MIGHKHTTEAVDPYIGTGGRGAFRVRRRLAARHTGAHGNENVGISNDNAGEKPARRKTKVSPAMLISWGSVGT